MVHKTLSFLLLIGALAESAHAFEERPSFYVQVTGNGRPIILIPGLSASSETWDSTVQHYKDRFECHVLSLAGFAGKPRIDARLLDTVAKDLVKYVRAKKLD